MISLAPVVTPPRLRALQNSGGYDYLLALPDDYAAAPAGGWPVILFLHGSAFRGGDITAVGTHGLPRLVRGDADLSAAEKNAGAEIAAGFVVVAPQCPELEVWDDARVLALLDEVEAGLNVDAARVYLTGLSMGGFGAWSLGMRHPQRFAALVPICGGGRIADVVAASCERRRREALRGLGVWAFHGAKDVTVPPEESTRMIAALKTAGVRDARLTIYPDAEHDAWSATYANPALYAWLRRHGRRPDRR
jgi:predicted peptidase